LTAFLKTEIFFHATSGLKARLGKTIPQRNQLSLHLSNGYAMFKQLVSNYYAVIEQIVNYIYTKKTGVTI